MLEGRYTRDTVFAENDHRRHRKREWLLEGLDKIATLEFLTESGERTLGQAALGWLWADPAITTVLPNIYGSREIAEFAAATETPPLTEDELARVAELYERNFGVTPAAVS